MPYLQGGEQITTYSGAVGFYNEDKIRDFARNSGGVVSHAQATVTFRGYSVVVLSGNQPSFSGLSFSISHSTSGQVAELSGNTLVRYDLGTHSGLDTANVAAIGRHVQLTKTDYNILCRSGLNSVVSGTGIVLQVFYATRAT